MPSRPTHLHAFPCRRRPALVEQAGVQAQQSQPHCRARGRQPRQRRRPRRRGGRQTAGQRQAARGRGGRDGGGAAAGVRQGKVGCGAAGQRAGHLVACGSGVFGALPESEPIRSRCWGRGGSLSPLLPGEQRQHCAVFARHSPPAGQACIHVPALPFGHPPSLSLPCPTRNTLPLRSTCTQSAPQKPPAQASPVGSQAPFTSSGRRWKAGDT